VESARPRERGGDVALVTAYTYAERAIDQVRGSGGLRAHQVTLPAFSAVRSAASSAAGEAVAVAARATTATSKPSHGPPQRRTASRRTRLQRFLTTAPPSFLPATKTTRPSGPRRSGVRALSTRTRSVLPRRPDLNSASISLGAFSVRIRHTRLRTAARGRRLSGAQDPAALATTCSDDGATARGRHAGTESVGLRAPAVVRLESALAHSIHSIPCGKAGGRSGKPRVEYSRRSRSTTRAQSRTIVSSPCPRCQRTNPSRPRSDARLPADPAPDHRDGRVPGDFTVSHDLSGWLSPIARKIVDNVENAGYARARPVENPSRPIVERRCLC